MENKSISAHLVVINPSGVKPAENKTNSTPEGGASSASGDFAQHLAAQIQGERPLAEVSGPTKPGPLLDPLLLNEKDKTSKDAAVVALSENAIAIDNPLIPIINLLAQLESGKQIGSGKNEALALETDLDGKGLEAGKGVKGLDPAAIEAGGAAKFAASDKSLPLDFARDLKVESDNPSTLTPGSLTQLNRAPAPTGSPIPTPLATVAVPVGDAGWDTAFSQRVVWVATNTQQIAQLHLNPPNLGPLEIRITLSSDQANAAFTSPHAAVREAIEAALPRLREMLADNGLSLGNVNVSSQSFQQQHPAQAGQGDGRQNDPLRQLQQLAASGNSTGLAGQGNAHVARASNGLVDIFA